MTEGQTLWLSETPDQPGSRSWNSSLPRVFTWGRFRHKENKSEILVINTHYDHISEEARFNSSRVIIDHIFSLRKGTGTILLGDFNASEDQQPVTYLTKNVVQPLIDAYRSIHKVPGEEDMTFYGWDEHVAGNGKRLDYIFCTGDLVPLSSEVVDFNISGRYPSDHMPVIAEFK
jgi:endonuclease/exonuclease/phosphatase family metal-dependent hydrolase